MKDKKIGPYTITETLLGQGSFSKVYLGYDQYANKVAIKTIPRDQIINEKMSVFEGEIKILNRCHNENIIKYLDVLKTKSNFYIVLEYCEGGNLAEYIAKKHHLDENETIDIFMQLIKGMNIMNKIHVVHRDLKPANILLKRKAYRQWGSGAMGHHNGGVYCQGTRSGGQNCNQKVAIFSEGFGVQENRNTEVARQQPLCAGSYQIKIADFGLAVKYSKGQMLKTYAGSPLNMAPQILKGQRYNEKVDVYSLGTILYEMLFGIVPYSGVDKEDLIKKIDQNSIKKLPHNACVDVSSDLRWLLKRMLEPNPQKRLSFDEVLDFLQKYQSTRRQIRFNMYKKLSASALPYICIFGGISSMFHQNSGSSQSMTTSTTSDPSSKGSLHFQRLGNACVYDMDLRLCSKLSRKLYEEKANVHLELVRV